MLLLQGFSFELNQASVQYQPVIEIALLIKEFFYRTLPAKVDIHLKEPFLHFYKKKTVFSATASSIFINADKENIIDSVFEKLL